MDAALGLDTSLVTCQYSANIIHLIHPNFTLGSAMITLCKNPAKPALKFLSHVALRTTMHSGATPLLRALIWYWDHLKNFIKEIPQVPLGMSIGTIWVTQKRSQGPPARVF